MKRSLRSRQVIQSGFTLVELIIVMVVMTVMAATLTVFVRPAMDAYINTRVRAELADQADTATQRLLRDVRQAVPNSIRVLTKTVATDPTCVEMVPSSGGGRYRSGPDVSSDTANSCPVSSSPASNCSAAVDTLQPNAVFDVLSPLQTTPSAGDWVVVGNQNGNDVYAGSNRAAIASVSTPSSNLGKHRITLATGSNPFPAGYDGARFMIVPNSQQAVFYVCSGADGTVNGSGDGKGTLYRFKAYGFNSAYPTACPSNFSAADVVATRVQSCSLVYDPNHGATQQSGFLWLRLDLTRNNETATLAAGAHVSNVP